MSDSIIKIQNLTKFYGKSRGIIDVNLDVKAGEIFGYMGPNGSGKTTTIRILLDLIRPSRGSAIICGQSAQAPSRNVLQRVGYLPGELSLYHDMSVGHYLQFFAGLKKCDCDSEIEEFANRLDCNLSQKINSLSQGNKQKVGLIQAFMHRPELIILDEPTNSLDPLMRHELFQIISEVKADGRTVFFSSHVLSEVERICDRAAIIRKGKIVKIENIAELQIQSLHDVEIHFFDPVPENVFENMAGIDHISITQRTLKCRVKGDMDPLIKLAAKYKIKNFLSHQPNLEEIFLAYYGDHNHED